MEFKTITKNEIGNGFINRELVDYEKRVRSGNLTKEEKSELADDYYDFAMSMLD